MDGLNIEIGIKLDDSTVASQLKDIQKQIKGDKEKNLTGVFDLDTSLAEGKIRGLTTGFEKLQKLMKDTSNIEINPFRGVNTRELNGMLGILKQLNKYNQGININFNANVNGIANMTNNINKEMDKMKSSVSTHVKEATKLIQEAFYNIGLPATSGGKNLHEQFLKQFLEMPKGGMEDFAKKITQTLYSLPRLAINKTDNLLGVGGKDSVNETLIKTRLIKVQEDVTNLAGVCEELKNIGFVQEFNEFMSRKDKAFKTAEDEIKEVQQELKDYISKANGLVSENKNAKKNILKLMQEINSPNISDDILEDKGNQMVYWEDKRKNIQEEYRAIKNIINERKKQIEELKNAPKPSGKIPYHPEFLTYDAQPIKRGSVKVQDSNGKDITDTFEKEIKQSKQFAELLDELKAKGTVTLKFDQFDKTINEVQRLTATVETAEGKIEKLQYRLKTFGDNTDIGENNKAYVLEDKSFVDKTDKISKKLEKQKNRHQESLNNLKANGVVGEDKINEVQGLLDGKIDSEKISQIRKKIAELNKEEKALNKQNEQDSGAMIKMYNAQIKKLDELENKFKSLKFIPNDRQFDITSIKDSIKKAKQDLGNGGEVNKNLEITTNARDRQRNIKRDEKTKEALTKTEIVDTDKLIKKVDLLGEAYVTASKKDEAEAQKRKALYEDIFGLQKKITEQTKAVDSIKTGDTRKELYQKELDSLNKELKEKRIAFNKQYYRDDISKTIKANDKEFNFDLLEQRTKEIDEITKKSTTKLDELKVKYAEVLKVNENGEDNPITKKIAEIESSIKGLDPIIEKTEDGAIKPLGEQLNSITETVRLLETEVKNANNAFKEQQKIVDKIANIKDEYSERLSDLTKDSKYLSDKNDIEPFQKKLNALDIKSTDEQIKEVEKSFNSLINKEKESTQEAKALYREILDIQQEMIEQNKKRESLKTGDNSWIIADDRYKELEKKFSNKKDLLETNYENSGFTIDENAGVFEIKQQKAKELDTEVNKLKADVKKMEEAFRLEGYEDQFKTMRSEIDKLDPSSKTLAEDIVKVNDLIRVTGKVLGNVTNGVKEETDSFKKLIKLENEAHSIREDIAKSSNANEIAILNEKEALVNQKMLTLSQKLGIQNTNVNPKNTVIENSGINDSALKSKALDIKNPNALMAQQLLDAREMNRLDLELLKSRTQNNVLLENASGIYQQLNKLEDTIFNLQKKILNTSEGDLKDTLESQLNAFKNYKEGLEKTLDKHNIRDANKDALLRIKEDTHKSDITFLASNPNAMGYTDLEKFKKQQAQYLSNLEEKFGYVIDNSEFSKAKIDQYKADLKDFAPTMENMIEEMDKVIKKHREFKSELQDKVRINKFGERVGNDLNIGSNINDAEKYIKTITNGKGQITQFGGVIDDNGKKLRQIHYTMEEGKNRFSSWTLTVDESTKSVYKLDKGITDITNRKQSFKDILAGAFASITGFTFISGAVMGVINSFKEAIKYTNEMDNAITDLSKVVDLSSSQLNNMREASLQLGEELGKSSLDIAKAMAEAGKQFKNVDDIKEFVRVSTMASNVTDMTAEQSAKALTTTMKVFKQNVRDVKNDLDSFNELQNNFRVNGEDLAQSITKVGEASRQAGMNFHQLNGLTTGLIDATGITGDEAGDAIKAIVSKTYALGRDGGAGKAQKFLKSIADIDIRNAQGDYKAFNDVLEELHGKWDNLTNAQKINLSQAIGGTERYSQFQTIMENYDTVVKATNKSMNSINSAYNENQKYLQSTEGKLNKLKVAYEKLSSHTINSDFTKGLIDGATGAISFVDGLVSKFGMLKVILATASISMALFSSKMKQGTILYAYWNGLEGVIKKTWSALKELPNAIKDLPAKFTAVRKQVDLLRIAVAINGGGFSGFMKTVATGIKSIGNACVFTTIKAKATKIALEGLKAVATFGISIAIDYGIQKLLEFIDETMNKAQNLKEQVEEVNSTAIGNIKNNSENISQVKELGKSYDKLRQSASLSKEDQQKLYDVQNQLAQICPDIVQGYDSQGNAIIKMTGGVQVLIDKLKEKNRLEALKIANNFENTKENFNNEVKKSQGDMNSANTTIQKDQNRLTKVNSDIANLQSKPNKSWFDNRSLSNLIEEQKKLTEEISKQNGVIDENKGKLAEAKGKMDAIKTPLLMASEGYGKLSDEEQQLASGMVATIDPINLNRTAVNNIVKVLGNTDAQPTIEQMVRLQKSLSTGKISSEQFENSFNGLISDLSKVGSLNMDNASLKNMFKDLIKDSKESAKGVKEVEMSVEDLQKNMSGNFEDIEKYGKFLSEIKEKGTLSASSKKEILTKEPDLIPFLTDTNKLMDELNKRVDKHKKNSVDDYATIAVKQESESINTLVNKYKDLSSLGDLNTKQKQDLAETADKLKGKVEGLTVSVDANGKTVIQGIDIAKDRVKTLNLEGQYIQMVEKYGQEEAQQKILAEINKTDEVINQVKARKKAYQDEIDSLEANLKNPVYAFFLGKYAQNKIGANKGKIAKEDATLKDLEAKNADRAKKIAEDGNKKIAESEKNVNDITNTLTKSTNEHTEAIKANTLAIKEADNAMKDYENRLKSINSLLKAQDNYLATLDKGSQKYRDALHDKKALLENKANVLQSGISIASSQTAKLGGIIGNNESGSILGQQIVADAQRYLGKPYVWGGTSPSGFDCSGLVQYVYQEVLGKTLNRTTYEQINEGMKVSRENLQPGDLVFFGSPDNPHHVGIYAGSGEYIHAPKRGDFVKMSSLSDRSDFLTARRIIKDIQTSSNTSIANIAKTANGNVVNVAKSYTGQYADIINEASQKYGVPTALIASVIKAESDWRNLAENSAGAMGIMQVTRGSAQDSGFGGANLMDIKTNIMAGTAELARDLKTFGGDYTKALSAYNAGIGAVQKYGGIPPYKQTQEYVPKVLANLKEYGGTEGESSLESSLEGVRGKIEDLQSKATTAQETLSDVQKEMAHDLPKLEYESNIIQIERASKELDTKIQQLQAQNSYEKENSIDFIKNLQKIRDFNKDKLKVVKQEKTYIEEQLKNPNGLYDDSTIEEMKEKLSEVTTSVYEQSKNIKEAIIGWINGVTNNIEVKFKDTFDMIDNELSRLSNQEIVDLSSQLLLNSQKAEATKQKISELSTKIKEFNDYLMETGDTTQLDQLKAMTTNLESMNTTLSELNKNVKDSKNSISDLTNTMLDKIKQVIQKTNEIAKEELNNNLKLFESAVDKEIKKLDEAKNKMDNNETNYDNIQNIVKLQQQLNALQGDDISTKAKKAELQQQLDEANRKLKQDNNNQEIDARKNALEKAKDEYNKAMQTYSDTIDKSNTDANLNQQASTSLISGYIYDVNGNKIDLQTALTNFEDRFGQGLTVLGNKIKTEVLDKLKEVQNIFNQFGTLDTTKMDINQVVKNVYATGIDLENAKAILGAKGYKYIDTSLVDTSKVSTKPGDLVVGNSLPYMGDASSITGADRYTTADLLQIYKNILNGQMKPTGETVFASGENLDNAKKYLGMFGYSFENNGQKDVVNIGDEALVSSSNEDMKKLLNKYAQKVLDRYVQQSLKANRIGNVYASGVDLSNAKKYLEKFGYNFIDTNDISNITLTPKDIVVGGSGVMKGASKSLSSGANWLWGTDKIATETAISNFANELKKRPFNNLPQYKDGGDVNYTGLAMVHGTEKEPETMLNYKQGTSLHKFLTNIPQLVRSVSSSVRMATITDTLANSNVIRKLKDSTQVHLQNFGGDEYNFEFNVDKLQATEDEANNFAKRIIGKVKKRGF